MVQVVYFTHKIFSEVYQIGLSRGLIKHFKLFPPSNFKGCGLYSALTPARYRAAPSIKFEPRVSNLRASMIQHVDCV